MLFLLPGTPGKETKKLVALCVLFVVVLGALWWFSRGPQTAPSASQVRSERPAAVEDAERPLPLGTMRVQAVADGNSADEAPVPDETGIPAPAEEISDREGTIEKGYLFSILKAAKRIPAADLKSRSKKVPLSEYFDNPENWRGKVMRVEGKVLRLTRRRGEELPEGMETLYEAQIMGQMYVYYVFIIEKPRFGTGDLVTFDGIFMKVHAYENRKGTTTLAPLFVCKNFEKLEIGPSPFVRAVGWATLAVVVVALILAIIITGSQRRSSEAIARAVGNKRLNKARQWAQSRKDEDTKGKS